MNITLVRQPHDQKIHVQIERLDSHAFEVATIQPADDDPMFREADPRVFGARLFEALFPSQSPARHAFDALAPNSSICLITDDADLQSIPWEYMRDARQAGTDSGFVVLKHILVRGVGDAPAATQPATTNRLRVLAVISDPLVYANDTPVVGLNIGRERETLRQAFTASQTPHHVTFVKPATLRALHNQLAGESHAVLHFIGHGVATPSGARLLFEHPSGVAHEVSANEVIAPARGRVSLVFLNACESATTMQSPVSNLAREWVVAGVPHAIGMQFKVPEVVALRLSETFYRYLAQSNTVQASLHQARRALWADDALQRMPTTDGGTLDYRPFALGIAVLYEGARAPATAPAPAPAYAPSTSDAQPSRIDDPQPRADFDPTIPDSQTFRGRAADMARLGRLLEHGHATEAEIDTARRREGRDPAGAKVIVIRGEGGMGKSTLARHAARRFGWRFPAGIQEISLEILPKKEALIGRIGNWLFGEPFKTLADERAREAEVIRAVRESAMLLILDNYETLVQAMQALPTDADARALAQFIAKLAGGKSVLLITSRDSVSGLAGARELILDGLNDEDGQELFWDFAPDRRRVADESLALQLVAEVGGHPLALELLGSAYADFAGGLPEFLRGLATQLAHAQDFYKTDRHATLGGCFDYSFLFLPEAAQQLFPRLQLFESPVLAGQVEEIFELADARAALNTLTRKSLIRAVEVGEDTWLYVLHPTARWYAEHKADRAEVAQAFGPHYAALFERLARAAHSSFAGKTDVGTVQLARLQLPDLLRARVFMDAKTRREQDFGVAYLLKQFGDLTTASDLLAESAQLAQADNDLRHLGLTLHEQANVFVTRGDLDKAMLWYQQSLDIKEQLGDLQGKSATLHAIANVFVTRGDLDKAMLWYQQSLDIQEQLGDLQGKSATLHAIANVFVTRGDLDKAMLWYQQSAAIDEQLGDLQGKSATLHQMAGIFVTRGDLDKAMLWYQQSAAIDEQLGDLQGKSATLHAIANVFVTRGDLDKAMLWYQQSLDIKEQLGDLKGKSATLHAIANVFVTRGDLDKAMLWYQQSLDIQEQLGDLQGKSATLHQMAGIFVTRGDLDKAMLWYQQSLDIQEQLGDLKGKSATLHQMAGIFVTRGDLDKAMLWYQQSLDIKEQLGDLQGKSATLHAIANVFVTRGDLDKAMLWYQQSLDIQEQLGDLQGKSATLHAIANVFVTRGDLDKAMLWYQQSLDIKEQLGDLQGKSATLANVGVVLFQSERYGESLSCLIESLNILVKMGATPNANAVANLIGQFKNALGEEKFVPYWQQVTGNPDLPDWLK